MPRGKLLIKVGLVASLGLAAPSDVNAQNNMLFILDGSNSMWGKVEGQAKIKTAQDVLTDLMGDLSKDTKVGLMVYGHRSRESCDDIEILSSIGQDTPAELVKKIRSIQPKGKTPIANALLDSVAAFSKLEGQNNHVVLISDGIETCGGDPCLAAGAITYANIKPRVHVVGFDVGAKERAQLECISKMGKGQYFSAANAGELKKAIAQVKQVAQAAPKPAKPPKPKKKGLKEVFRDDFKGEEVAEHWEIINPNPDAFIVEDGKLLMVSAAGGAINQENVENLFRLSTKLPKGDWVMSAKFEVDYQTQNERPFIGLYQDPENYLVVQTKAIAWGTFSIFYIEAIRMAKGKAARFEKRIWESKEVNPYNFDDSMKTLPQPIVLRIRKEGRKYWPGIMLEGEEKPKWVDLGAFTILRQKGQPAVGLYQAEKVEGESTAMVDWLRIEVPEK